MEAELRQEADIRQEAELLQESKLQQPKVKTTEEGGVSGKR